MTQGWTRALVEGKEPGCGAGCGGRGDFPLRRGVMFIFWPLGHLVILAVSRLGGTQSSAHPAQTKHSN